MAPYSPPVVLDTIRISVPASSCGNLAPNLASSMPTPEVSHLVLFAVFGEDHFQHHLDPAEYCFDGRLIKRLQVPQATPGYVFSYQVLPK